MHEGDKLDEARYFLSKMTTSVNDTRAFRFELSAFLSSARSVLQYVLDEAKTKTGGQAWYDAQVSGHAEIKFFKDKRDINIHREPVAPLVSANLSVTEVCRVSESVRIKRVDEDGNVINETIVTFPPAPSPVNLPASASLSYSYTFPDWSGTKMF